MMHAMQHSRIRQTEGRATESIHGWRLRYKGAAAQAIRRVRLPCWTSRAAWRCAPASSSTAPRRTCRHPWRRRLAQSRRGGCKPAREFAGALPREVMGWDQRGTKQQVFDQNQTWASVTGAELCECSLPMQTGLQTLRPPRHASLAHPALETRRCLRCIGVTLGRPAPRRSHVSRAQDVHDDEPTEAGVWMRDGIRCGGAPADPTRCPSQPSHSGTSPRMLSCSSGSTESLFMRELKRRGMSSSTSESADEGRADSSAGT